MNQIEFLQSKLLKNSAFLVISPENRSYLTDFPSSKGYLIISKTKCVFLIDARYIEAAQMHSKNCDEIVELKRTVADLNKAVKELGIKKFYTESKMISHSLFSFLSKSLSVPVIPDKLDNLLTDLRREKRGYEKERILKAQGIAEKAFEHILKFIKPGVTEIDIRLELEFFMLKNGAESMSFETIVVSGKNTSLPHGVPSEKKVETGDFVTMDYGVFKEGYCSDMTRTVAVGCVSDKQAEVYNTVLTAQLEGLKKIKAGEKCYNVDLAAREIIEKAGYGKFFGHATGHGIGIEVHEAPVVSPKSKETLRTGDIISCEPGIYIPSTFGVRIEDLAFVTETGCENLTKSKKSLIIL